MSKKLHGSTGARQNDNRDEEIFLRNSETDFIPYTKMYHVDKTSHVQELPRVASRIAWTR